MYSVSYREGEKNAAVAAIAAEIELYGEGGINHGSDSQHYIMKYTTKILIYFKPNWEQKYVRDGTCKM